MSTTNGYVCLRGCGRGMRTSTIMKWLRRGICACGNALDEHDWNVFRSGVSYDVTCFQDGNWKFNGPNAFPFVPYDYQDGTSEIIQNRMWDGRVMTPVEVYGPRELR